MKKQTYKWLRNVGLSLMGAAILTGCADENFDAPTVGDEVQLTFAVAESPVVTESTRAGKVDNFIDNLHVLIYNNSNNQLVSVQDLGSVGGKEDGGKFSKSVTLGSLSENDTYTFYAITNSSDKVPGIGSNISQLSTKEDNLSGNYISMSGKVVCKKSELTSNDNMIVLHRNVAKLNVTLNAESVGDIPAGFTVTSYSVLNALPITYINAGADNLTAGTGTSPENGVAMDDNRFVYMAPKGVATDLNVLINTNKGWYCVPMSGITDIKPNHHYQVQVKKFLSDGFSSADEAKTAPLANLDVTVIDHSPKVFSLVSTGTHTLGVPESIETRSSSDDEQPLSIKTICKETGNCTSTEKPVVTVTDGADWIKVEGVAIQKNGDNGNNVPEEPSTAVFYEQELKFSPLIGGDYREGKVMVKWGVLTRTVKIRQYSQFNGSALGTFTITSTSAPGSSSINGDNYFDTFLKTKAVGVDETAMCGVDRVQGFHFPMGLRQYKDGSNTTYSYKLTNVKTEYQGGSYVIKLKDGSKFAGKVKINDTTLDDSHTATGTSLNNNGINITWEAGDSWDYIAEDGALIIEVTKGENTTHFSYDLYHTGFFYNPEEESYLVSGTNPSNKFLYYEVIPVETLGKTFYWLDRNIGATAAGMYIENENGVNDMDASETNPFVVGSQGNLYGISNSDGNTLDASYCPPGFRVPTMTEFNSMTNLAAFKTVGDNSPVKNKTYWTAYLQDSNSGRLIHFPKNRYVQAGGTKAGTGNTGYYWTCTQAVGASGSEKGKWWQAVTISGGAASVIRYRAYEGSETDQLAGMSIRAIKDEGSTTETLWSYKLEVDGSVDGGYTHVYLYALVNGSRVPLNNWPGDQITRYSEISKKFDYDFTSYSNYDNVYVILNRVRDSDDSDIELRNKLEASWFSGTGKATPASRGYRVMSGNQTPWQTRVTVPYSGASGDETVTYRIYWYKDDVSNGNYRDRIQYRIGSTGTVSTKVQTGTAYFSGSYRYYVDLTVAKDADLQVRANNSSLNNSWDGSTSTGYKSVKNSSTSVSGQTYNYTNLLY